MRSPKVWLDRFCIDQMSICTDLQCLPICLGGLPSPTSPVFATHLASDVTYWGAVTEV